MSDSDVEVIEPDAPKAAAAAAAPMPPPARAAAAAAASSASDFDHDAPPADDDADIDDLIDLEQEMMAEQQQEEAGGDEAGGGFDPGEGGGFLTEADEAAAAAAGGGGAAAAGATDSLEEDKPARMFAAGCRECGSIGVQQNYLTAFNVSVCFRCQRQHPQRYALLTQTSCVQTYMLPLAMVQQRLGYIEKVRAHTHTHESPRARSGAISE